mgnify:CR=1 FL=1
MAVLQLQPVAVAVARQNLALNGVSAARCRVWEGDRLVGLSGGYDVVVANILAPVILGLLPDVRGVMARDGRFICSGILMSQQDEVVAKARALGFHLIEAVNREEWVALAMTLDPPRD